MLSDETVARCGSRCTMVPSAPEQGSDGTDELALFEMQPCRLGPLIGTWSMASANVYTALAGIHGSRITSKETHHDEGNTLRLRH